MVKINTFLLVAVLSVALVATVGSAFALTLDGNNPMAGLTVTADTVQANGNYIGVPTLINSESHIYGYNYTFVPDGSYTVTGTITNDNSSNLVVGIALINKSSFEEVGSTDYQPQWITSDVSVAAGDKAGFSITVPAGFVNSADDIGGFYRTRIGGTGNYFVFGISPMYSGNVDFSNADYINAPQFTHTVDEGPMSDMSVVYVNGHLQSSSLVVGALNQTSDQINAVYSGGKFDFKGSPLYSFVL